MDTEPQAWRGGVVLIRIGVNDISSPDMLGELSRDPGSAHVTAVIEACLDEVGEAVALIRKQHPDTYILLVGVISDLDWSADFNKWQSAREVANINAGLDLYDRGLRKLAATDKHVAFLDDRAWFERLWGSRDGEGRPAYKTVHLAPGWNITNKSGDEPHNAVLADGHPGVVWNALWAQNLVTVLNAAFGLKIKLITDAELSEFLRPSFAARP